MATIASKLPPVRRTLSSSRATASLSTGELRARRRSIESVLPGDPLHPLQLQPQQQPDRESHALIGWFEAEMKPKLGALEESLQSLSSKFSTFLEEMQTLKEKEREKEVVVEMQAPAKMMRRPAPSMSMPPLKRTVPRRVCPRDLAEQVEAVLASRSFRPLQKNGLLVSADDEIEASLRTSKTLRSLQRSGHTTAPDDELQSAFPTPTELNGYSDSEISNLRGIMPVPSIRSRDGRTFDSIDSPTSQSAPRLFTPGSPSPMSPKISPRTSVRRQTSGSMDMQPPPKLVPRRASFGTLVHKSASVASFGSMLGRLRHAQERQGERTAKMWNFLENPESSLGARRYANWMPIFVVFSVLLTLFQAVEPIPDLSPLDFLESPVLAAVVQTGIDIVFLFEVVLRLVSCPNKKAFLMSAYTVIDVMAVLPLLPRLAVGCVLPTEGDDSPRGLVRHFLIGVAPLLRLLKVLRHFKTFQLLFLAFKRVFEALPVLLYTQLLITLVFSPLIYYVEPRDNIGSLPTAIWLTLVTMTTVGYGDVVPTSWAGSVVVATLVVSSMIFVAFPLGIIGQTFTQVWRDRDRILLMQRTRDCLDHWGYTAREVHRLFTVADRDGDGQLSYDEFRDLMHHINIGLSDANIRGLFKGFDYESSGTINEADFIWTLYPGADLRTPSASRVMDTDLDRESEIDE